MARIEHTGATRTTLRSGAGASSRRSADTVARDFEAVLLGQMFRIMQGTVAGGGVIERSFQRQVYEEMLGDEFAKAFAERGGLGLHRAVAGLLAASAESAGGSAGGADGARPLPIERKTAPAPRPLERGDRVLPLARERRAPIIRNDATTAAAGPRDADGE